MIIQLPVYYDVISQLLPHRYPMLMIDSILEYDPEARSIKCTKNLTNNEYFFTGHFPSNPVCPGVLIIEAVAQASILLIKFLTNSYNNNDLFLLLSTGKSVFKKMAQPGNTMVIQVSLDFARGDFFGGGGKVFINNELIATVQDLRSYRKVNGNIENDNKQTQNS